MRSESSAAAPDTTADSCITYVWLGTGAPLLSCMHRICSVPNRNPSSHNGGDGQVLMSSLPVFPDHYDMLACDNVALT